MHHCCNLLMFNVHSLPTKSMIGESGVWAVQSNSLPFRTTFSHCVSPLAIFVSRYSHNVGNSESKTSTQMVSSLQNLDLASTPQQLYAISSVVRLTNGDGYTRDQSFSVIIVDPCLGNDTLGNYHTTHPNKGGQNKYT